jgi:hypothetical protein
MRSSAALPHTLHDAGRDGRQRPDVRLDRRQDTARSSTIAVMPKKPRPEGLQKRVPFCAVEWDRKPLSLGLLSPSILYCSGTYNPSTRQEGFNMGSVNTIGYPSIHTFWHENAVVRERQSDNKNSCE